MTHSIHSHPIKILECHLDFFGHVNHATYLILFEQARWDLITSNGYGVDKIKSTGCGPVILDLNMQFIKELRLRNEIIIQTYVTDYQGKVGQVEQVMQDKQNISYCQLTLHFGLFDLHERKLIKPTPEWLRALAITA